MVMGFFAREWERTCAECGYTWRVPRSIARGGMSGTTERGMFRGAGSSPRILGEINAGIEARAEQKEAFRICAKCGADDFTQRPVPRP
jgi:predicted nucleic-acid-binding Zn-ribbon protein